MLRISEAEVERLTAEHSSIMQEMEQLKNQLTALQVENDMLTVKLEHQIELDKHKDEIISLLRAKVNP